MRGLRSQYVAEKNKIKASKVSGAGEADVYRPKLWTYNLLTFLESGNIEASRPSTSNIKKSIDIQPSQECDYYNSDNVSLLSIAFYIIFISAEEVLFTGTLDELNSSPIIITENTPDSGSTYSQKRKKNTDIITNFFTKATDVLKTNNQRDDHITKFTEMLSAEMRLIKNKPLLRQLKAKTRTSLYETQDDMEQSHWRSSVLILFYRY